jgi:hypothetical protein
MNDISKKLLDKLLHTQSITVRGVKKQVLGMALYATTNSPDAEYVKVAFSDASGMYFALDDPTVFYFDRKLGSVEELPDGYLGKQQELVWRGKKFTLANANDYQYVKQFYIGTLHELEGEVRFSDYTDEEGNVLSLGVNMFEGKRDDVYAEPLKVSDLA